MNERMMRLGAFAALAVLAAVLMVNLITATSRFVTAFEAYDELELALTSFHYTNAEEPIQTTFRVSNPTDSEITVISVELRVNAGVRRVGGGEHRPMRGDAIPGTLQPGTTVEWSVPLAINERNYVRQLPQDDIDWQVSGRIQVRVDAEIREEWIPFVVAFLPDAE